MSEPWYAYEDIGCGCQSDDPDDLSCDSEWEWQEDDGYWQCTMCGDIQ